MSNRQRTPEELAFNATVGSNIKYLRKTRNLNQSKVAAALTPAVSFQQIQKYENGKNGICALKLKQLADFFKVGCDVLVDPNMITAHRGFTGNMDWFDKDINKIKKYKNTFDATKYEEFDNEYPPEAGGLENDPKMQATYDAILEDK